MKPSITTRAIAHLHKHEIIHRDIKPSNFLITERKGQPFIKLIDLGLARLTMPENTPADPLTGGSVVMGTAAYMAPEQALDPRNADARADIYSLGAILYEMLTGQPPFAGADPVDVLKQVTESEPASPCALNPTVNADLETICLKCLQKDPDKRFQSVEELEAALTAECPNNLPGNDARADHLLRTALRSRCA